MRTLLALSLIAGVAFVPTPGHACDNCDRDGSRHVLVEGEFVRYHRVRFKLSIRIHEGERDWVDTVDVVPMALPMKDGEPISWSALEEGDVIEANIRETERERVVTTVTVVRMAERESSAERRASEAEGEASRLAVAEGDENRGLPRERKTQSKKS